jgi:CheY-like chemotaxis protein
MNQSPLARMKALVIDDDEEVLAFAAEVLNSFAPGFDVATARDLEEAILWLGMFHPDLLMVDPRLCGDKLSAITAALQGDHRSRGCKIVVLSSNVLLEWFREPERFGAHAILAKPLQLQDLLRTVQSVVGWSVRADIHVARQTAQHDPL